MRTNTTITSEGIKAGIRHCFKCDCEQIFDNTFDEDCIRCSECGCLPYNQEEWNRHQELNEKLEVRADLIRKYGDDDFSDAYDIKKEIERNDGEHDENGEQI